MGKRRNIRNRRRDEGGGYITPVLGPDGYERVPLEINGGRQMRRVDEMVLEAFVGPRPEGCVPIHLDGDRLNSRLENLEWGTPEEE